MCAGELKVGAEGASAPPVGTWEHCLERRILPNLITYALHQQNVKQIKYVASVEKQIFSDQQSLETKFRQGLYGWLLDISRGFTMGWSAVDSFKNIWPRP